MSYVLTADGVIVKMSDPLVSDYCPHAVFTSDEPCPHGCTWIPNSIIENLQE